MGKKPLEKEAATEDEWFINNILVDNFYKFNFLIKYSYKNIYLVIFNNIRWKYFIFSTNQFFINIKNFHYF